MRSTRPDPVAIASRTILHRQVEATGSPTSRVVAEELDFQPFRDDSQHLSRCGFRDLAPTTPDCTARSIADQLVQEPLLDPRRDAMESADIQPGQADWGQWEAHRCVGSGRLQSPPQGEFKELAPGGAGGNAHGAASSRRYRVVR